MKKISYSWSLVILLMACEYKNRLAPVPKTLISEITAFENAERIQNQINGLYATFKGTGFWGSQYIYYSEARAGNFVSTNINPLRGGLSYQMNVDASTRDVSDVWTQAYQIINAANLFLERLALSADHIVQEDLRRQYTAEARFLRGITYYFLVQLYAPSYILDQGESLAIPLRLQANTGLRNYDLSRSTVGQVYAQIVLDLDFAEENLPLRYANDLWNTTRAHRNTAIAFKSSVYLAMGDYPGVILESNKLVPNVAPFVARDGVAHRLEAQVGTVFSPPYTSLESIFSMPFTANDLPGIPLGNAYLPDGANASGLGVFGTGDYYLLASGIVAQEAWQQSDARRMFVFETTVGSNAGRLWCIKYAQGTPFSDFIPVVRYSQVLLNLAEARAKYLGLDLQAISLLNAVRTRADPQTIFAPSSQAELIALIAVEREIEFLGEGIHNSDLVRQLKPIPAKNPIGGSPVPEVAPTAPNYLWPLPTTETLYNKAL